MKIITFNFNRNILAILVLLPAIQGCSDFLEQEPGSQVSITEQLGTKNGMLMALTGAYGTFEGAVREERFAVYADLLGGNLKFTPTPSGSNRGQVNVPSSIENTYSFDDQALGSDLTSFYDDNYEVINQANLILEYVDDLPDAGTAEKDQIRAEALALRGYSHYVLSLVYAQNYTFTPNASHPGIIYRTESLDENLTYPARETVANTYALILNDMQTALDLMQNDGALPGPGYSYFNPTNVKALMARIYLSRNDWQSAYDMADAVITGSGVSLVPGEEYVAEWEKASTPFAETLMELTPSMDQDGAIGGSLAQTYGFLRSNSYGDYVATQDLLDLFEEDDVRGKPMFLEIALPTLVNGELEDVNYYFTKKFQDAPGLPLIRLSEMYLIKAEAAFELSNAQEAVANLNVLRTRANASPFTLEVDLETEIVNERRRELNFEGHLFFDLARRHKDVVRNDGCMSNTCNLNYPSSRFVLPIPQKNINLNQNLEQNEGY